MADNTTISAYDISAPPMFRLVESGDSTIIQDYATSTPLWRVNGKIGGGVKMMTTDERIRTIPDSGDLIYDTTNGNLYVGDGTTVGGVEISDSSLEERMTVAEENIQIILADHTPVQGTYSCGDWTPDFEGVVAFGGWTAA